MNQIKCPNCGTVFKLDESGYNEIVRQVRDETFEKEIERNRKAAEAQKDSELRALKSEKESEIKTLKAEQESELKTMKAELEKLRSESMAAKDREMSETVAAKDREIAELKARLDSGGKDRELAVLEATKEKEKELADREMELEKLRGQIEVGKREAEISEKALKDQYEIQLRAKDEQIEYYKDLKARQSTKMVGESLERHCETEFNKLRATAFRNAYFEKDNDARTGSKGDFIYRDFDDDGTEFISIMFEMKNEMDTTASKHRNEDFFKELDKDRREKNCEYAVLVSLLEADNDLYNEGIVDVSYRYDKMYVVRPQFFIPVITMLRNASLKTLDYRKELAVIKAKSVDITNFEDELGAFQKAFEKNYSTSRKYFEETIKSIDNSIRSLEIIKEKLTTSVNQLRLANDKAQDLSIRKLTKNSPGLRAEFAEEKARKAAAMLNTEAADPFVIEDAKVTIEEDPDGMDIADIDITMD